MNWGGEISSQMAFLMKKRNRFQILQCFQFQFWRPSWVHNSPATSPQALNILIDHQILLFAHFPKVVNPRPKKGHFFVDSNETRTKITCTNKVWHNFFFIFFCDFEQKKIDLKLYINLRTFLREVHRFTKQGQYLT